MLESDKGLYVSRCLRRGRGRVRCRNDGVLFGIGSALGIGDVY